MSSYVYYKFNSQKTESRIAFDGTGISVFDLKKEIIFANNFGKASDFDLLLFDSSHKEYNNDSQIIPRSTSVIAKRMPPSKPGKGKAAIYIAGAPTLDRRQESKPAATSSTPQSWGKPGGGFISKRFDGKDDKIATAKLNSTLEHQPSTPADSRNLPTTESNVQADEAELIKAMFQANAEHWEETQERMSHVTPVFRGGAPRRTFQPTNQPQPAFESKPLPPGYICHRCSKKGHWIQDCPTNDDRDYDNRPRMKRTTGIPRSFLKTVEVSGESTPQGVMVTPDGGFVIAQPDMAAWEKQQSRSAPLTAADIREKPPTDTTLACPICSKLFRDAVKTPCCSKTFDEECIQTHLLERDFVCPSCHSKVASLDKLVLDSTARDRVRKYIDEEISKSISSGNLDGEVAHASSSSPPPPEKLPIVSTNTTEEEEYTFDEQPGSGFGPNSSMGPSYAGFGSVTGGNPADTELAQTQTQLQQVMLMLSNPQLAPPMRIQLQMQFQQLTMHLNNLQQMSMYATGSGAFGGMSMIGVPGQMMGAYGNGTSDSYRPTPIFNNPGLLSDAESPYQRVALNNRRTQKRQRQEDFLDANGNVQKFPRFYE